MGRTIRTDLASAFGVPAGITPFIPELLADLWSLGIPPEIVVELLRPLNLHPRSTRVLDLGCGKGAVSITLARELGFTVEGMDFFPPFVEEARKRAEDLDLSGICRFMVGDIREAVQKTGDYDIAMQIWVGGALGGPGESVGKLRRMVRPGGYMVLAEGYLKEGADTKTTHGGRLRHSMILRELTAHGDTIVREIVVPQDQTRLLYEEYISSLQIGARRILHGHPEFKKSLEDHVKSQEQMCRAMEASVAPAVWLLFKT